MLKRIPGVIILVSSFSVLFITATAADYFLTNPRQGVLDETKNGLQYTPKPDYVGLDQFVIKSDNHLPINIAIDQRPVSVSGSLKDENGNPISSKNVTFRIRGKTRDGKPYSFDAVMDENGVVQKITPIAPTKATDIIGYSPKIIVGYPGGPQ